MGIGWHRSVDFEHMNTVFVHGVCELLTTLVIVDGDAAGSRPVVASDES